MIKMLRTINLALTRLMEKGWPPVVLLLFIVWITILALLYFVIYHPWYDIVVVILILCRLGVK